MTSLKRVANRAVGYAGIGAAVVVHHLFERLWPSQAVACARGRDFEAALVEAEERQEVWEPADGPTYMPGKDFHLGPRFGPCPECNGCGGCADVCPCCMRCGGTGSVEQAEYRDPVGGIIPPQAAPADLAATGSSGEGVSLASATPSPPPGLLSASPAGDESPAEVGVTTDTNPAGNPSSWNEFAASVIRGVLEEHRFVVRGGNKPHEYTYHCEKDFGERCRDFDSRGYPRGVDQWGEHIAALSAERLEKSQPAPFAESGLDMGGRSCAEAAAIFPQHTKQQK